MSTFRARVQPCACVSVWGRARRSNLSTLSVTKPTEPRTESELAQAPREGQLWPLLLCERCSLLALAREGHGPREKFCLRMNLTVVQKRKADRRGYFLWHIVSHRPDEPTRIDAVSSVRRQRSTDRAD